MFRDEEDIDGMKRRISKLVVYINKYQKTLGNTAPAGDNEANETEETDVSPADEDIENTNEDTNIVIDETAPTGDEELDLLLVEYNLLQRFLNHFIIKTFIISYYLLAA